MTARLRGLQIAKVDLVDKGAAINPRITLFKRHTEKAMPPSLDDILAKLPDDEKNVVLAAIQQAATDVEPDADDTVKSTEAGDQPGEQAPNQLALAAPGSAAACPPGQQPPKKPPVPPAAMKSLPAELRKKLEEADELRERVTKMEALERRRSYIEKARKHERGAIGLSLDDTTDLLNTIDRMIEKSEAPKPLAQKLEKHFAAVAELIKKSALFREEGSSASGGGDAEQKITSLAKQLAKEDKISFAKAYDRVLRENPELYREYESENPMQSVPKR